jgi:hypothetical protein
MISCNIPSGSADDRKLTPFEIVREGLRIIRAREAANRSQETNEGSIPEHRRLTPEVQSVVSKAIIRMSGFSADGEFLGLEKLRTDLRMVSLIEQDLVIEPEAIRDQLVKLQAVRAQGSEASDDQQLQVADFAALGGHVSLNSEKALVDVLRKRGYVFMLEYPVDGITVPGGYMYGFSETFEHDERFPTLGISSLSNPKEKVEKLRAQRSRIITNWRTGIPLSFQQLADHGVQIPESLLHSDPNTLLLSPRHWGGGTALKLSLVAMGQRMQKEILMLNVGTIESIHELLGVDFLSVANVASERYNGGFLERSAYPRQVHDRVMLQIGQAQEHIANVVWNIFHSTLPQAFERLTSDMGALKGKGGWQIEAICRYGQTIAAINQEFLRVQAESLKLLRR